MRRISETETASYADIYEWLRPGELLGDLPETWAENWNAASAETFAARA